MLNLVKNIFESDIVQSILGIIVILFFFIYLVGLITVLVYEKKINKKEKEKEDEMANIRNLPLMTSAIDGRMRHANIKHDSELSSLYRKRQFIIDKLPFLKS